MIGVPCAIMDKRFVFVMLFVGFLLVQKAQVQEVEHAPTVAQCQADQRLWLARLEDTADTLPPYATISSWAKEMEECDSVDPDNQRRYYNVRGEIAAVILTRLEDFLNRQGLWSKFIEENTAGKR
jgi:hypothetical protein